MQKLMVNCSFQILGLVLGKLPLNHGNLVQEAEMYSVKGWDH